MAWFHCTTSINRKNNPFIFSFRHWQSENTLNIHNDKLTFRILNGLVNALKDNIRRTEEIINHLIWDYITDEKGDY